jgi:hypothetical protein
MDPSLRRGGLPASTQGSQCLVEFYSFWLMTAKHASTEVIRSTRLAGPFAPTPEEIAYAR